MEQNENLPKKRQTQIGTLPGVIIILLFLAGLIFYMVISSDSRASNPAAAISTLRTISCAQEIYKTKWDRYGNMAELLKADTIDAVLAEATNPEHSKSGYYFKLTLSEESWSCVAIPAKPGYTGERSFFIDETGVIRAEPCMSTNDPPANENSLTPEEWREKQSKEVIGW